MQRIRAMGWKRIIIEAIPILLMALTVLIDQLTKVYFRKLKWERRMPRCKNDIPNLLLDIGYTYLFNFIESLLSIYGFDLYCGVHHTFFYQRKSLVCDLVEPFRCIIDQRIRKAYTLKQVNEDDFFFYGRGSVWFRFY